MKFKEWSKEKQRVFASAYLEFTDKIIEDSSFPDSPIKAQNRRYLRIEAGYAGYTQLLMFDDLWTEYEKECLPKKTDDWRKKTEKIRQAERIEICEKITEFISDNRTGVCDGFCDKLTDFVEKLTIEGA